MINCLVLSVRSSDENSLPEAGDRSFDATAEPAPCRSQREVGTVVVRTHGVLLGPDLTMAPTLTIIGEYDRPARA